MKYLDLGLRPIFNHKVFLALLAIIGSTLNPPGKVYDLYNNNKIFKFIYFFAGCYVILDYNLISTLLCVFFILGVYDLMRKDSNDKYKYFFIDIFSEKFN